MKEYCAGRLKHPEDGKCFRCLGPDGVLRIIHWLPTPDDKPTRMEVYDAVPLPPDMLKQFLDRKPWSQEVEDRYRGVDGTTVPQEQWMNPPPGVLPEMGTRKERREKIRFENERIGEERLREERGETAETKVCGMVISDYNLSPRG